MRVEKAGKEDEAPSSEGDARTATEQVNEGPRQRGCSSSAVRYHRCDDGSCLMMASVTRLVAWLLPSGSHQYADSTYVSSLLCLRA